VNFIDEIIARFQHRWNTDAQYRAMLSGVFGLACIVALCSCAGIVSMVTNNAMASAGFTTGGGGSQQPQGGGGVLQAAAEFPTATIAPWDPGVIPGSQPVPASQTPIPTATPVPTATPLPTATPCTHNCGGGGPTVQVTITGWSPNTWTQCSGGVKCLSVTVHTSVPNDGVNLIITACNGAQILSASYNPNATTDASGNYTFSFNQPTASNRNKADVWATAQGGDQNGVHGFPPCG
jgi:hypothetical protein